MSIGSYQSQSPWLLQDVKKNNQESYLVIQNFPNVMHNWMNTFSNEDNIDLDKFKNGVDKVLSFISYHINNKNALDKIRPKWNKAIIQLKSLPEEKKKQLLKIIQNKIRKIYKQNKLEKFFPKQIFKHSFDTSLKHNIDNLFLKMFLTPTRHNVLSSQFDKYLDNSNTTQFIDTTQHQYPQVMWKTIDQKANRQDAMKKKDVEKARQLQQFFYTIPKTASAPTKPKQKTLNQISLQKARQLQQLMTNRSIVPKQTPLYVLPKKRTLKQKFAQKAKKLNELKKLQQLMTNKNILPKQKQILYPIPQLITKKDMPPKQKPLLPPQIIIQKKTSSNGISLPKKKTSSYQASSGLLAPPPSTRRNRINILKDVDTLLQIAKRQQQAKKTSV